MVSIVEIHLTCTQTEDGVSASKRYSVVLLHRPFVVIKHNIQLTFEFSSLTWMSLGIIKSVPIGLEQRLDAEAVQ